MAIKIKNKKMKSVKIMVLEKILFIFEKKIIL